MNEIKHTHQQLKDPNSNQNHPSQRPYWTRAHRDWRVWVGVILMLGAMLIYLLTNDLAWRPRIRSNPPLTNPVGK